MIKESTPKDIKYTNKEIVMYLMKEVGESVTFKKIVRWEEHIMYAL